MATKEITKTQAHSGTDNGAGMTKKPRVPMMLPGQALQSFRDAGFDFAAALGEVIDNSLEADANHIQVRLDEDKVKGKTRVVRVVIVDDGDGMNEDVLHHYMQLGYSTRYMRRDTIGKYGVGAKLAALNFSEKIDVWSRTDGESPWMHITFDLQEAIKEEKEKNVPPGIDAPAATPIPDFLEGVMPQGSGTVVVWSKVDRLEEGRVILGAAAEATTDRIPDANELRVDVEKELSRIFRSFLEGGIVIKVNEKELLPHDPLFLMEGTWAEKVLNDHFDRMEKDKPAEGGQKAAGGRRKKEDPQHFPAKVFFDDDVKAGQGKARVRITVYPPEVVRERGKGGDDFAKSLRVPENRGRISFLRHKREISYTNVPRIFPRGVEDPDRFIGIEVSFTPELDEFFGVRHVKRGVEPHGQLRNELRAVLEKYLPQARDEIERIWGKAREGTKSGPPVQSPVVTAATDANRRMPKGRVKGPEAEKERDRILNDVAEDVVGEGPDKEKERQDYVKKIEDLPFLIVPVSNSGPNHVEIEHLSDQFIVRLNTRHRFYREVWEPIEEIAKREAGSVSGAEAVRTARRTLEALQLMLIAYGKAESMDTNPRERYGDLRMFWGQFLDSLMSKVKNVV